MKSISKGISTPEISEPPYLVASLAVDNGEKHLVIKISGHVSMSQVTLGFTAKFLPAALGGGFAKNARFANQEATWVFHETIFWTKSLDPFTRALKLPTDLSAFPDARIEIESLVSADDWPTMKPHKQRILVKLTK